MVGAPINQQRMHCESMMGNNDSWLMDHAIGNADCLVHVVFRPRGGAQTKCTKRKRTDTVQDSTKRHDSSDSDSDDSDDSSASDVSDDSND